MTLKKTLIFETSFATYTATDILGEGGTSRVYHATDESGGAFAIKLLDGTKANKIRLKRFKNEYLFGFHNRHKNILTISDLGVYKKDDDSSSPFYVMPSYPKSLRKLMDGRMAPKDILGIYEQILAGVEAAHLFGVVHRDLKPENVLIDSLGNPLVADFGIAHFEDDERFTHVETKPSDRLANFLYAAPEQRRQGQLVDQRADIYALGLMLNEMFTGEVPHGTSFRSVVSVDSNFAYIDTVVDEMLKQNPQDRPTSIQDVKALLSRHYEEFRVKQRLSVITETVIPVGEIDDLLVLNPITLIDIDYIKGKLILKLSQSVNEAWIDSFQTIDYYTSLTGASPQDFRFHEDTASLRFDSTHAQRIVDDFKRWLPMATDKYHSFLVQKKEREAKDEQERLDAERRQLEERHQVLRNVRI